MYPVFYALWEEMNFTYTIKMSIKRPAAYRDFYRFFYFFTHQSDQNIVLYVDCPKTQQDKTYNIQQKTWQMSRHWLRHYTTYDILENYCISQSFRWFPTLFWKSLFLCPKRRTFGDFVLKIPIFGFFKFLAILNNLKHSSAFKNFSK